MPESKYIDVAITSANRLINHGPTVLVSTRDEKGSYDIAPVAWASPVQKDPPKLLLVLGRHSQTYRNIIKQKEFVVCVPHVDQAKLLIKTGSSSGAKIDKFSEFKIKTFKASKLDILIPQGCIGYIECTLSNYFKEDDADIVVGQVLVAKADNKAFTKRLMVEGPEGKTLHHLGGTAFCSPSGDITDVK